ncbi:branched-chain amino acid transport system ATP-binding protein [Nocardioides daedukensis]|uniref:Branched-chain amino acid transport system ATP-binding protein n=1 Tax=Nocardioides daedukensis TaxID=634462 RepID=A0A7Y9S3I3_9ACTN|nr:ABC transporter ATP-binding protein [Nocardioides daedukensis]NYG59882.1 branched-chain amino acid transport system ATP-binding protein [Nocardioides daedukensis]
MTLTVDNVVCGYDRAPILHGVSLHVEPGELVAVVGSNGAGKSTLVKTICGLVGVRGGDLTDDGQSFAKVSPAKRAKAGIVVVPEGRRLFPQLTVGENIQLGRHAAGKRATGDDPVKDLLDAFPIISERWNQQANLLSGGEQQMVALTRAVAARPRYLLLDEPSLGLSPLKTLDVFRLVELVRERTGAGILLVEQMADQALKAADRAYVLEHGQIAMEGPAADVRASPEVRRAYLGVAS